MNTANDVISFWFEEIESKKWWVKDPEFDQLIRTRFGKTHTMASSGELYHWRTHAEGRLAEIIILDQFSRNIFRDDPRAFSYDGMALILAQECIGQNLHQDLETNKKRFLYMPYMHSESPAIHELAVKLFTEPGLEGNLDFELQHKKIIDRFGRYPHRNKTLSRVSTTEEIEFLKQPGSSF